MDPQISDADMLATLQRLDRLAVLADSKFRIPFTRIRFGLDSVIGLVPVLGETIGLLISLYLLSEASKLGAPRSLKAKMLGNSLLDWLIGLVPVAGDIADVTFKANLRNMKLLVEHIEQTRTEQNATQYQKDKAGRRWHIYLLIALLVLLISAGLVYQYAIA